MSQERGAAVFGDRQRCANIHGVPQVASRGLDHMATEDQEREAGPLLFRTEIHVENGVLHPKGGEEPRKAFELSTDMTGFVVRVTSIWGWLTLSPSSLRRGAGSSRKVRCWV